MSDLYIDMEMLERVQDNIRHISELMRKPGREMKDVDGTAMGASGLADRMDEFGDEWSYGIKKLNKFSDAAAKALGDIKKSFEDLDRDLGKALTDAGPPAEAVSASWSTRWAVSGRTPPYPT